VTLSGGKDAALN